MLRPYKRYERCQLAGDGFFLLGLLFFFLVFFLEFEAHEFEDGDFGAIADAVSGRNDAGVTAGAIGELGRYLTEELLGDGWREDVGSGLAARSKSVAFTESDELFGHRTRGFGTGQSGGDAAVFEQIGDEVAQGRAAVPRVAAKF
jgi:hypothetical protein